MTNNSRFDTRKTGSAGRSRTLALKGARAVKYAPTMSNLSTNGL